MATIPTSLSGHQLLLVDYSSGRTRLVMAPPGVHLVALPRRITLAAASSLASPVLMAANRAFLVAKDASPLGVRGSFVVTAAAGGSPWEVTAADDDDAHVTAGALGEGAIQETVGKEDDDAHAIPRGITLAAASSLLSPVLVAGKRAFLMAEDPSLLGGRGSFVVTAAAGGSPWEVTADDDDDAHVTAGELGKGAIKETVGKEDDDAHAIPRGITLAAASSLLSPVLMAGKRAFLVAADPSLLGGRCSFVVTAAAGGSPGEVTDDDDDALVTAGELGEGVIEGTEGNKEDDDALVTAGELGEGAIEGAEGNKEDDLDDELYDFFHLDQPCYQGDLSGFANSAIQGKRILSHIKLEKRCNYFQNQALYSAYICFQFLYLEAAIQRCVKATTVNMAARALQFVHASVLERPNALIPVAGRVVLEKVPDPIMEPEVYYKEIDEGLACLVNMVYRSFLESV